MGYRQTNCSATASGVVFLGGCMEQHNSNNTSVAVFYPTTMPTPVPKQDQGDGTLPCDCTYKYMPAPASGSVWASSFNDGQEYWQNTSSNQDMLTVQSFTQGGTMSFDSCGPRLGYKNVAAKRQWHGCYGWNNVDACGATQSATPTQVRYLNADVSATYNVQWDDSDGTTIYYYDCSIGGGRHVNGNTGIITSTISSTEHDYNGPDFNGGTRPNETTLYTVGGQGWNTRQPVGCLNATASYQYGLASIIDGCGIADVHCFANVGIPSDGFFGGVTLDQAVSNWNATYDYSGSTVPIFNYTTSVDHYNSSVGYTVITPFYTGSLTASVYHHVNYSIQWDRSETVYSWALHYYSYFTADPIVGPINPTVQSADFVGSLTLSGNNYASGVEGDCENLLGNWNLTDDNVYPWRTDGYFPFAPLVTRREVQNNVSPIGFSTYWVEDLTNPITDVNGNAPFTWGDSSTPTPPGWTLNTSSNDCEGCPPSDPSYQGPCTWVETFGARTWYDPNQYYPYMDPVTSIKALYYNQNHYDGTVMGIPLTFPYTASHIPVGPNSGSPIIGKAYGYGWFDFYYLQSNFCPQPSGIGCSGPLWEQWYYFKGGALSDAYISVSGIASGGQYSTILPMGSTHWINNIQAHGMMRGGFKSCGLWGYDENNVDSAIWAVKWAECRLPYPSYNYFRPCASDRVLIDEVSASCFVSSSPLIMNSQLFGLSGTNQVLINYTGTPADGIWTGCSQTANGDGTYTLSTGSFVSVLPTDYSHELGGYYNNGDLGSMGMVGIVRFPNAWPICGQAVLSSLTTGYSGSLTGSNLYFVKPLTNLRSGDAVDLYKPSQTPVASNKTVYRVDDNNFFVNVTTSSLSGSYWVQSHGSPDYHEYDTSPKYEFRYGQWNQSLRNPAFSNSSSCMPDCVPYTPCAPQVVCFSPNGESFPNGKTYWFASGSSFNYDGIYGSWDVFSAEFGMTDPLWQAPKCPCNPLGNISIACTMDDGTCQADVTDPITGDITAYYAHAPIVEASCTPYYSLPAGATFQPMTQPGPVGSFGYAFRLPGNPWDFYFNALANCAGCRFIYEFC